MSISREVKIGLTGIIALAVLYLIITFLQGANLFSTQDTYYINFRNAKALAKSSPVYADGYNVGIVSNIRYDYDRPGSGVIVEISVEHGMRVPAGTVAVLDEAMLGGCTLNLMMGNSPVERFSPGDTIPSQANNGLMARAAELMPKLEQTMAKVDTLLTTLNTVVGDSNIQAILVNARQLTASLGQSSRDLNHLLENEVPTMTRTFNRAGENVVALTDSLKQLNLSATMAKVDGVMDDVRQMTTQLNSKDNNIGLLLNDTTLYGNLNRTTQGAANLLEDLKANPKRYVHFSVFGKKDKKE
ncbi:MAG: MCE family protein [Bacteroidaceae bacterium]|nr:MCE family protein [Bacteroidaceae bacterium]MBQ9191244.1 MCE family protein [Bacteroidaceae bacterium]MBR1665177.1 MCE family protein [Bacteroidaceae bacterium]